MDFLESHGIEYNIVKEYANGVRVGNVPSHAERTKRAGNYQSWFPKDWDNEKILIAANYTVNLKRKNLFYKKNIVDKQGNIIGYSKFAKYENVVVVIVADKNNIVATIFPDSLQRSIEEMKKGG
ncbi:EndoU domain-containing protein [Clostridium caldaquaticum]|uniref:EndoU domain-containing protein n=1 Tax=Clostridium caldaquaticum TaxID=2940653 RepID=UPI003312FE6F